jgi:hypothetical protein
VTLKRGQHSKYLSLAFTEQGVAMLSSVLSSERALQVNIQAIKLLLETEQKPRAKSGLYGNNGETIER